MHRLLLVIPDQVRLIVTHACSVLHEPLCVPHQIKVFYTVSESGQHAVTPSLRCEAWGDVWQDASMHESSAARLAHSCLFW